MATAIKPIPVLTGSSARRFNDSAERKLVTRNSNSTLKEETEFMKAILKKANL